MMFLPDTDSRRVKVTSNLVVVMMKVTTDLVMAMSGALAQDDDVPSCQPGDHLLPDPDDCDSYYACTSGGEAVSMDCPEGLYFDPRILACNWADNVDCVDDSPETL